MPIAERKVWAEELQTKHAISIVMSCAVVVISRTAYYYKTKLVDDTNVISQLDLLIEKHPRWGLPKCFKRLRTMGFKWNYKRVHRVYNAMNLNIRRKNKKRLPPRKPESLVVPEQLNHSWSIDFMSDSLQNHVRFRTFNVIDDFNREALAIDINTSMPASRVIRILDDVAAWRGYPKKIRVDNGTEFTSHVFTQWAEDKNIKIDFIQPGSPYQNAFIERFNRTYREDILDLYLFSSLQEVKDLTTEWINLYNYERPHDSLNDMTPVAYKTAVQNSMN